MLGVQRENSRGLGNHARSWPTACTGRKAVESYIWLTVVVAVLAALLCAALVYFTKPRVRHVRRRHS